MFDLPETVETNRVTGATVINLGFLGEEGAAKAKAALEGKTFMNFDVCCAVCPGGPFVSISTTHESTPLEIMVFAFAALASA